MRKREQHLSGVQRLAISSALLAIGFVLPFFTGQIPQVGNMLLPMHIPVMLCGLICGWRFGAATGAILPLLRFALVGVPVFPNVIAMTCELATYGAVIGVLYEHSKWQCPKAVLRCLLISMLAGRAVWGIVMALVMGSQGTPFTLQAFLTGAFVSAVPGIIIQVILIPTIMAALNRAGVVRYRQLQPEH